MKDVVSDHIFIKFVIYFAIFSYIVFGNALTFNLGARLPVKLSELFSFFVIILFLLYAINTKIKKKTKEYDWVIIWLFIGFVSAIINTVVADYSFHELAYGLLYSLRIIHILLYSAIILFFVRSINMNPNKIINFMLLSFALVSLIGIFQYFIYPVAADWYALFYRIGVYWPTPDPHMGRLISTYFDPNYLSSILVIPTGIVLYKMIEGKNKFRNLFLFVLFIISILLTKSRSGILGTVIILFGALLYQTKVKKNWLYFLGSISVLAPALLFMVFFSNITAFERIRGIANDNSAMHRFISWGDSFSIIGEYPLFGIGFNMYGSYVTKIQGNVASASGYGMDSSILFAFVTTGLVGGFILLYGFFKILLLKNKDGMYSLIKIILFASIIMSFFNNLLFNILWLFPFSLLLLTTNYQKEWCHLQ